MFSLILRELQLLFFFGMRIRWVSAWPSSGFLRLFPLIASPYASGSYPESPDTKACSQYLGYPLSHWTCQAAVDNLPRGALPSIFTPRAHTATNNYIQVPINYADDELSPSCQVTIDLDGHSLNDQFVFVPWDEIREMAQVIVDLCVDLTNRGGFITYGVGRTFESLIHPTNYDNTEIPTPAWVRQPDGTAEFVAIPNIPEVNEYSTSCGRQSLSISNTQIQWLLTPRKEVDN